LAYVFNMVLERGREGAVRDVKWNST